MAKKVKKAKRAVRSGGPMLAMLPAIDGPSPDTLIDIPPTNTFNQGLHSASEQTMLNVFGVPGQKTDDCSPATGAFKARIVSAVDVGPFKVSGLDVAVQSLKAVFADANQQIPNVVAAVKTAGMLCVRHKRGNPNSFSNHSWGSAIDLFFGTGVVPMGSKKTYRGCLQRRRSLTIMAGIGAPGSPGHRSTVCISSLPMKQSRPNREARTRTQIVARAVNPRQAATGFASSTMRTTSAMMRFNS